MTDAGRGVVEAVDQEQDNPRLDAWLRRSTAPLDMLALCTIWLTVVPLGDIHRIGDHAVLWFAARIAISFVYFVDMAIRTSLAHRKVHYLVTHPVGVFSIFVPALRLIFSIRLLRAMFRKGNLLHFLGVAVLLFANLTVIVYGFEHRASDANITTIGISAWWAFVTFFTVGYGDYYPVTIGGRIFATMLMALGLVVAAVITAQIASSFMDQAAARRSAAAAAGDDDVDVAAVNGSPDSQIVERFEELARRTERRLASIEHAVSGGRADPE